MGPNIPGGYPPGGQWPHDDGGGRRRKRKKKGGFIGFMSDLIAGVAVVLAIYLAIEAVPYLLKFEPGDIMDYSDSNLFGKVEVLMDGLRHKRGVSEMKFSHDGKSVTLIDDNGKLSGIEAEGYGYDEGGEMESDFEEARRILEEWGLLE